MGVDVTRARSRGGNTKVKGVPELLARFRDLKAPKVLESIAYKATFGTAKSLRELAADNARTSLHDQTGALGRAFAIKKIKSLTTRGYTVGMRAGARGSKKEGAENAFYWWHLEFGTRYIAPKGFFRRAFETLRQTGEAAIIRAGTAAVLKAANTALRNHKGNG